MVTQGEEEYLDIHQNREGLLETYIRAVKEDIWQTTQNTRPRRDNLNQTKTSLRL